MSDNGNAFAIRAPSVFDGEHFLPDHCVIVHQGTVTQLLPADDCPRDLQRVELATGTLAPGLVDLQVNGGGDLLFNNAPSANTVHAMLAAHRGSGTTAILPTFLSDTRARQQLAVAAVRAARAAGNPGILGIHLEGPFFEPARRGAHSAGMIRPPQDEDMDWLCSLRDLPTVLTVAPEHMAPGQIRRLGDSDIRVCAGHSNATCEQVLQAVSEGLQGITHLFNAMSPLTHREPGMVGAALDTSALSAGLIADGIHVDPVAIRIALAAKRGPGHVFLVTDAMAPLGTEMEGFELNGRTIRRDGNRLTLEDGTLAGADIDMAASIRFLVREVGVDLDEALRMATAWPARALGTADGKGTLGAGTAADFAVLDDDLGVVSTWIGGRSVFMR